MAEAAAPPIEAPTHRGDAVRDFLSKYGLIAALLALPVYLAITDLADDGNLTRLGNNLVDGISNGSIYALIALGYTLVYGIIELINFAHGDVFMVGAFTSMYVLTNVLGQDGPFDPRDVPLHPAVQLRQRQAGRGLGGEALKHVQLLQLCSK